MAKKSKLSVEKLFNLSKSTSIKDLSLENGSNLVELVQSYATKLMEILANNIEKAYRPGGNRVYVRSGKVVDAAKNYRMTTRTYGSSITVTCNLGSARHRSLFSAGSVNSLLLMDTGYKVKKKTWFSNISWFGYRTAGNIITNTLREFQGINKLGLDANIIFNRF